MAAVKTAALVGRLKAAFSELIATPAQVVFARRPLVGLLVIAAAATEPRYLALGLFAVLGAAISARLVRLPISASYAPYGYNALLVGLAIARDFACNALSASFALALGGFSVLMTAALSSLAGYLGWVPVLSLPFVFSSWFALGIVPHLALTGASPTLDSWSPALPALLGLLLQSLGSFLLIPKVAAGLCVMVALLIHSRISTLLAVGAALLVLSTLQLAHAPLGESVLLASACNASLAAVALGGVWFSPSRSSFLLAFAGALLAAFVALGCAEPLYRLGLPIGFLPLNVVVIGIVAALRQRVRNEQPRLAEFAAESPEQLLLADVAQRAIAVEPGSTPMQLPFRGLWTCTQGVDGAYTHKGILRHAFDFEVYGEAPGALCSGNGARPDDFHCFGMPVLAAADGTVVAVEGSLANNAIGEVNADKPWGNYVMLQHADSLYSLCAHLAPGTLAVEPGQYARRGALLGQCGNSGRSPRPHLHFQLQYAPSLGAATLACRFTDVVVRTSDQMRFEASFTPREGDALRTLQPDPSLASYFDLPIGAELSYRVSGTIERLKSEIDGWGWPILRSIDRRAELVFTRSETSFACGELRGSPHSVLRLLRISLPRVPFEAHPELGFRDVLPECWLGGWLRTLRWDVTAPFVNNAGVERWSRFELDGDQLAIIGVSRKQGRGGMPLIQTRALLRRGVGPTLLELNVDGRMERAELVAPRPMPHALAQRSGTGASTDLALGMGDWS